MSENVHIRYALRQDLEAVHGLVRELALFEKEPEAVSSTIEDYQRAFDSGLIGIIVAELEGNIVGMAMYFDTFSSWKGKMLYLDDFVVNEAFRSHGIGKLLFDAVIKEAKIRNCVMMKWQVLDWNEGAINFYKRYHVTLDKAWIDCKLYFN